MSAILPPYTGETARCAKCGSTGARTRYQARLDPSARIAHELRSVAVVNPEQERLCRECGHCHFHWDEATVDAEKPVQEQYCTSRHQTVSGIEPCILNARHIGRWHEGVTTVWPDHESLTEQPEPSCSPAVEETVPNNQETP